MTTFAIFRVVALATCLVQLLLLASAQSPTSDKARTPLAVVNGQSIYDADLTAVGAQLWQLRNQEYQLKSSALESVINQKLLEAEASGKGVSADKLLEQEVDAKLGEPSDAELEAFYLGQKDRLGNRSFAELKDQLRPALKQTKIQQARQDYYKRLREKAEVSILLDAPKVEVKADPGRLRGDAKAPLTIVEFSDFQCPYCQGVQATLNSNVNGADEIRSFVNARTVTAYLPGFRPSIVNCDSCESFCLIEWPALSLKENAY